MKRDKRILLSLDNELHGLLKEISGELDKPSATVVYEILSRSKSHFVSLLQSLKDMKSQPIKDRKKYLSDLALCHIQKLDKPIECRGCEDEENFPDGFACRYCDYFYHKNYDELEN